jgi:hypothetical protein
MSGQKKRTQYVAENRNPLARSGRTTAGQGGSDSAPEQGADSEAPTGANPARRPRLVWRGPLLTWILGLLILIGVLVLLVLLWTGRGTAQQAAVPTRGPILGSAPTVNANPGVLGGAAESQPIAPTVAIPPVGAATGATPAVGAIFQQYYATHGGQLILGNPVSDLISVNGREIQWFERARVEHWPEYAGTPYEIQLGRLGAEYTSGRQFAPQQFFVSRPDLRFFVETGHALGGAFLSFWSQNGATDVFGLPISEEFDELLPDGKTYRVQYFERVRLELHPEAAGAPYGVQVGLLGTALYRNDSRPHTIQPVPTAVPLP